MTISQTSELNDESELISLLERLNLSKQQSRVYLELIKMKKAQASQICESTGIHDSKIYKILSDLENRGLIVVELSSPKLYHVLILDEGLENLRSQITNEFNEKNRILDELNLKLTPLYDSSSHITEFALILKSEKIILNHINSKLQSVQNNVKAIFPNMYYFNEFKDVLDDLGKENVTMRIGVSNFDNKTNLNYNVEQMVCDTFYIIIDDKYLISVSHWNNKDIMYAIVTSDSNIIHITSSFFDNPACRLPPIKSQEIILELD